MSLQKNVWPNLAVDITPPSETPMSRVFLHLWMSNGEVGWVNYLHMYLEFCGTYDKNSNSCAHVFEVKLFNGANSYVTGSRYVTGNRYGI